MTTTDPIADFLNERTGDYAQAFKFEEVGDTIAGTITHRNIVDGTDLKGEQTRSMVITVVADDGAEAALWVKSGNMLANLGKALRDAKPGEARPTVAEGDRIAVKFTHTEPSKTAGFAPKKIYAVSYKAAARQTAPAPAGGVNVDDLI